MNLFANFPRFINVNSWAVYGKVVKFSAIINYFHQQFN